MAKQVDRSLVDMDRLSRIFSWLIVPILIFMLGMVFSNGLNSELAGTSMATTPVSTSEYALSYPAAWSAASGPTSFLPLPDTALSADSEELLVLDDTTIEQRAGDGGPYLVTLAKLKPEAQARYAPAAGATNVTIAGAKSATKSSTDSADRYVIAVGTDRYVLDVVTTRGEASFVDEVSVVVDSLDFNR